MDIESDVFVETTKKAILGNISGFFLSFGRKNSHLTLLYITLFSTKEGTLKPLFLDRMVHETHGFLNAPAPKNDTTCHETCNLSIHLYKCAFSIRPIIFWHQGMCPFLSSNRHTQVSKTTPGCLLLNPSLITLGRTTLKSWLFLLLGFLILEIPWGSHDGIMGSHEWDPLVYVYAKNQPNMSG